MPNPPNRPRTWWSITAAADYEAYLAKATVYGSRDLEILGTTLATPTSPGVDPRELGITIYLLGKIARALAAYQSGTTPSDDTWHDITTYSMMSRLFRHQAAQHNAKGQPTRLARAGVTEADGDVAAAQRRAEHAQAQVQAWQEKRELAVTEATEAGRVLRDMEEARDAAVADDAVDQTYRETVAGGEGE